MSPTLSAVQISDKALRVQQRTFLCCCCCETHLLCEAAKEYSDARLEFSPSAKMKEQEEACVFIVLSLFFVAFQSKIRENIWQVKK